MARPEGAFKYKSVEELSEAIELYFDKCDEDKRPYTISGMAYALGIDRKTLLNYSKEECFFHTVKSAKERIQAQLEENALMGKANSTFTIFNLKNNYGWRDNYEVHNEGLEKVEELLTKIESEANDN